MCENKNYNNFKICLLYWKQKKNILHFQIIDLERQASILTFKIATEFGLHNDKHEKAIFYTWQFYGYEFHYWFYGV